MLKYLYSQSSSSLLQTFNQQRYPVNSDSTNELIFHTLSFSLLVWTCSTKLLRVLNPTSPRLCVGSCSLTLLKVSNHITHILYNFVQNMCNILELCIDNGGSLSTTKPSMLVAHQEIPNSNKNLLYSFSYLKN